MKSRKPKETDAEYIARLEMSIKGKSEALDRYRKAWRKVVPSLSHSAAYAAQVLQTAAEITGMPDDPEVVACTEALASLATIEWHADEDVIVIPPLPVFPDVDRERFGGDAEMILQSAIEAIKQSRPPWSDWTDVIPEMKGVDPADLDWIGIADEVYSALTDLDFGRGLLRLDLRSTMYDHCFTRIQRALQEASKRQREAELVEMNSVPF